jgi:flagellar basal-body rod protein FlgC
MTTEFVDALEATRAYEANIGVLEITKDLTNRSLQIVA